MICRNCGNFNEDTNTICAVCGASLVEEAPVEAVAEPFAYAVPQEAAEAPVEDPGKTLGTGAMVLGIVSIVSSCCTWLISVPLAIAAIVCGFIAMNKSKEVGVKNTFAIIGLALGGVGIAASVIALVVGLISGSFASIILASGYY